MLTLGGFPPSQTQSLLFPTKTYQTHFSFSRTALTHLRFCAVLGQTRTGFCAYALKSPGKGGHDHLKMGGFDNDYEDDDEEEIIPLRNMRQWLENKPPGFGEGKEYDTSIEDKLLEEIEQSKRAQLANINNLKNNPQNPNSKEEKPQEQKASEDVPSGIRVRVDNLPKKKNIHRDLQLAFRGAPGIVNIIPAVSGNRKTRDPICKGLAFVDFKSKDEANRFVQIFSGQSITFGKTQKQIKCEIINSSIPSPPNEQSIDGTDYASQLAFPTLEGGLDADFDLEDPSSDSWEETVSDEYKGADDEHVSSQWEDNGEILETFSLSEPGSGDSKKPRKEPATNSSSLNQLEKIWPNKKKVVSKRKGEKVPKLKVPGSANRLKVKEKAVLMDVFSKYASKADSAAREKS